MKRFSFRTSKKSIEEARSGAQLPSHVAANTPFNGQHSSTEHADLFWLIVKSGKEA